MPSAIRRYFQLEKPRFHQFLAHCIVRRALRSVSEMNLSDPPVIGIVAGENPPVDEIQDALTLLRLPDLDVLRTRFPDPLTVFLDCEPSSSSRPKKLEKTEEEFLIALKGKKAVFAVAEEEEDMPVLFRKIADRIIHLQGPTPRHIKAAFAYCVGVDISLEEAGQLTNHSLFDLTMAASRGRSWRKVLDVISDDKSKSDGCPVDGELALETLAGLGEAGAWGRELAVDLKEWQAGKLPWSDVNRGVLVVGPPGTGKTSYAKALAKSCGVELIASSLAQWQSAGHLGDLLKAMRRTFAEARKKAPCILFLDEFDSVGDRGTVRGENALYVVEKINGLLECLDGVEDREGIVVVAACNHPEFVDPAFLRPGRLEKTIRIPLPDHPAREQILRWHLKGTLEGEDLADIADRLEGHSGADIEKLVRDARRKARKENRDLILHDLTGQLPKPVLFEQEDLRRIAIHEAGHAIVHSLVGEGRIVSLHIEPGLLPGRSRATAGALLVERTNPKCMTRKDHECKLMVHLAGLAAEKLVFGDMSDGGGGGPHSDLASATRIATELEASYGLGSSLVLLTQSGSRHVPDMLLSDTGLRSRVDKILGKAFEDASALLQENKTALHALADALVVGQKLDEADVLEIISAAGCQLQRAG
ncbi:AAA family ATPase [Labrenzia sp. PHM005]|uniref:AAA family ATPase n=1 Tax=Labrenzia sp. PHM005 TaxID=2590016 RepID=UPI001140842D|nr:AAA family ATPase [Labrenzia sp. PHM005]QDG77706.1 AAA family ATPase [Labrenzia sp. PHM005]